MSDAQIEELVKAGERKKKRVLVYKMLLLWVMGEGIGIHRDWVAQRLNGTMSKKEVDDALDYLDGEGHIFIDIFGVVI